MVRLSLIHFFVAFCLVTWLFTDGSRATDYFVSGQGNDAWSGTLAAADRGKNDGPFATLDRARKEIRKRKSSTGVPSDCIRIWIKGGRYPLSKTVEFGKEDSGTPEAGIVYQAVKGERVVFHGGKSISDFVPVKDPKVLKYWTPAAREKVRKADLKAAGVTDFGSVSKGGMEVFFRGKSMQLARWPNEGFVKIVDVAGNQPIDVRGTKGDRSGQLIYEGERPSRWTEEADPWLHGYWFWDWSDSRQAIGSIDVAQHLITLKPPQHGYGYRKGQWYYGLNLLSELDSPGEWYVDRAKGVLYFWPPSEPGKNDEVMVSVLDNLLRLNDVENVSFRGLEFEVARGTAISISGGKNVQVAGCVIRNVSGYGVVVSGGEKHRVTGCDLHGLGNGGISLRGGDRKTLTAAGHEASNNHLYDFGRWVRMYSPGVRVSGVGIRVAHNLIHNAPHQAISFSGNNHLIEWNEIHHVCLESNDAGAIYAGRDWTMRGTVIRNNYLHDMTGFENRGCVGVYLDDLFGGTEISGNVFHHVTRAAFVGGGRDVMLRNNIFVDCDKALHIDARGLGWASGSVMTTMKTRLDAMPIHSELWKMRYPRLPGLWQDEPAAPKGNVVTRNLFQGKNWNDIDTNSRRYVKLENNLVDQDLRFVNAANNDFRLREDSPAWKIGFQKIPFEKIGLIQDESRALLNQLKAPATH